jgi:hypothetical protein
MAEPRTEPALVAADSVDRRRLGGHPSNGPADVDDGTVDAAFRSRVEPQVTICDSRIDR